MFSHKIRVWETVKSLLVGYNSQSSIAIQELIWEYLPCSIDVSDDMSDVFSNIWDFFVNTWDIFSNMSDIFPNMWDFSCNMWDISCNIWDIFSNMSDISCNRRATTCSTRKWKMTGSYILCNKLHHNGLMTDLGLIFLTRAYARILQEFYVFTITPVTHPLRHCFSADCVWQQKSLTPNCFHVLFSSLCDSKTAAFSVLVHRLALVFSALLQGCDRCDSKKTTLLGVYTRAREGGVRESKTSKSNAKHKQARPLAFRSTKSYFCKVHLSLPAGRKKFFLTFPRFFLTFGTFRRVYL